MYLCVLSLGIMIPNTVRYNVKNIYYFVQKGYVHFN